ncbi:MAG TPA: GNAT family N-acetyltransferase [Gemmatimonadaceae bacterium]|nr:GNAT family N-acetyltransferase [Gemmatimonadaceae bacterium]
MSESHTNTAADDISSTYALFQQPWWLDAVAPGEWSAVEVQSNGVVTGRLPFRTKRVHGLTVATMPPLTPVLGPWIRPHTGRTLARISEENAILEALVEQVPRLDLFRHACAPDVSNCLPFLWHDFDVALSYTYRLDDLSDLDRVWKEMRDTTRQTVRKAEKTVGLRTDISIERLFTVLESTFVRQGLSAPFTLDFLKRIDAACVPRGRRRVFAAEDAQGRVHAVAYIVWDDRAAYYLLGGGDPELRRSGAQAFVLWEAIRFAQTVTKCFDFEGSVMRPIEQFFRGFGGRLTPYAIVTRMSARMRLMYGARDAFRSVASRMTKREAVRPTGTT